MGLASGSDASLMDMTAPADRSGVDHDRVPFSFELP